MLISFSFRSFLDSICKDETLAESDGVFPVLVTIAVVLWILYNWPVWDRHLYPPGPCPLPFIGHTLWLTAAADLSKKISGRLIFFELIYIL